MTTNIVLPNKLRIKDGVLFCNDGEDITKYLKTWATEQGISEDTPLTLTPREDVLEMYAEIFFLQNMAAVG